MADTKMKRILALLLVGTLCTGCTSVQKGTEKKVSMLEQQQEDKKEDKESKKENNFEKVSIKKDADTNKEKKSISVNGKSVEKESKKENTDAKSKKDIDDKKIDYNPVSSEDIKENPKKENLVSNENTKNDNGQKIEQNSDIPVNRPNKPVNKPSKPANEPEKDVPKQPENKPIEKPVEVPNEKPAEKPSLPESTDTLSVAIQLVNEERKKNYLPPLIYNASELQNAANQRARESAETFDHTRPDGRPWHSILNDMGLEYHAACENIYFQYGGSYVDAVNGWMNSSGHYANMMNPNVKQFSIGKVGGYYAMLLIG